MNITGLEIEDKVHEILVTESEDLGITVLELIRYVIGEHIRFSGPVPLTRPSPVNRMPSQLQVPATEKFLKLAELMFKYILKSGSIKCPECTLPLTFEAIEQGKCPNCGAKI